MTNESNSNSSITKNDSQKKKKSITKNKGVNFVPEVVPI